MEEKDPVFVLCDRVRETSYALHRYLRACRVEHGLLVNFGAPELEIRKFVLSDRKSGHAL
jgi:hypothetical protein